MYFRWRKKYQSFKETFIAFLKISAKLAVICKWGYMCVAIKKEVAKTTFWIQEAPMFCLNQKENNILEARKITYLNYIMFKKTNWMVLYKYWLFINYLNFITNDVKTKLNILTIYTDYKIYNLSMDTWLLPLQESTIIIVVYKKTSRDARRRLPG